MIKIPYGRQEITDEDIQAVVETLKSPFLTQGPRVEEFEKNFSNKVQSQYAVAVNNATAGLHLAVSALNLKPSDRVLVTANSFVATANCVRYCQADVEFVDIDSKNFCIDLDLAKKIIHDKPKGYYKGLICVDFAGHPVDLSSISPLLKEYSMWLIADGCHAVGAQFQDQSGKWHNVGGNPFADITTFSFHPVKHIATGEGGMLTTNSELLFLRLKKLRSHGVERNPSLMTQNDGGWYYEMQELGWNYRLSDIHSALGTSQLKRLDQNIASRRQIAARYSERLSHLPIELPNMPSSINHAFHLYIIQTDKRDALYKFMHENGIYCQVHYLPIPDQPYYKKLYPNIHVPNARNYYSKALSLPMFHSMTEYEQNYVIENLEKFFSNL